MSANETTPLLGNGEQKKSVSAKAKSFFGPANRILFAGFLMAFTLGITQVPIIYIMSLSETAFFMYIVSSVYGALFIPTAPAESQAEKKRPSGVASFFAPLKVIVPRRYALEDGRIYISYGLIFLAIGIFLGVFASTYAPTLLQMYATSEFNFGTTENGWLMFGNSLIRGLFLLFMFPRIISAGRDWINGKEKHHESTSTNEHEDRIPTRPEDFPAATGEDVPQEPVMVPEVDEEEEDTGTSFDLLFVRWSLVVDSIVTATAAFSSQPWQIYMTGFLLPFASGSAPAAKGVMTEMCPRSQRQDAIAGITLVESAAMLLTQGLFGIVFAAFSEAGQPRLTFFCNAGFAIIATTVLFLSRFPPPGSKRIDDEPENE
ncbi:hypothetical protein TruAng_002008 [Truncatella angustata]|nr:hypothetical protein TruAng_002008 [Truncatella angustata]